MSTRKKSLEVLENETIGADKLELLGVLKAAVHGLLARGMTADQLRRTITAIKNDWERTNRQKSEKEPSNVR